MTPNEFRGLVDEALASIPQRFRDAIQNVAIVIEDEPTNEQLAEVGIEPPDTLLGLYEGTPLTERQWAHGNTLPDKVTLFQLPIEDASDDEDDVVVAIGETLIHELGHYFGLSEEEIEEIEEEYWRAESERGMTPGPPRFTPPRPKPSGHRRQGRPSSKPRPRKRFGQHFLAESWARRVVAAVAVEPGDVFLEIGPGTGALTLPLAETGRPILAVDIDRALVAGLAPRVPPHVTVMAGDVLATDLMAYLTGLEPQRPPQPSNPHGAPRRYRVVGNLPYNIASPILFRLLAWHETHGMPVDATVMVQREVADRLAAKPGTKAYGVLTVLVRLHADVHRLFDLPPGAFHPRPKVRSSVIRLVFRPPTVRVRDTALFERMVKAMFGQRRKTLANTLKAFRPDAREILAESGLDGRRRPETLQLIEMAQLADLFAAAKQGPVL